MARVRVARVRVAGREVTHVAGVSAALAVVLVAAPAAAHDTVGNAGPGLPPAPAVGSCLLPDPDPPEYYTFPLVTTKRVPEARVAGGTGGITFARSPFAVAVVGDGSYHYRLHLSIDRLREPLRGTWVAWVTTPELDRIQRIGPVAGDGTVQGRVEWNKFLVVITLEEVNDPSAEAWSGPIALRGMSRSGKMHTMAGHGPFQQENCAAFGYGN